MTFSMIVRRCRWDVCLAIVCSLIAFQVSDVALAPVHAQTWPSRTITAVVPFTAGSAADVIGRIVLDQTSKQIGRPIVIENRGGAGGTLGAGVVAKAAPDGHTFLVTGALASGHALFPNRSYDTLRDLAPVIALGQQPLVLVVAPSKGFKTLRDLIVAAKAKVGVLNFSSAGVGSASHFAAERLRIGVEFEAQHIPFRGATEAITEVLAGRVDFAFLPIAAAMPFLTDGALVALAVSASKRAVALPNISTVMEAGWANSAYEFWVGLFLPAKTPHDIVVKIREETEKALQSPSVQGRLAKLGVDPMPMSPDQLDAYFRADVESNLRLVKAASIPTQ